MNEEELTEAKEALKAKMEAMNEGLGLQRLKNWGKLTPEEKIERMRFEMHRLARHVGELSNLLNQLTDHQHLVDGRPATRLGLSYCSPEMPMMGMGMVPGKDHKDDVYF